ncbi:hypothetical protein SAMN05216178_6306 [Pseudomonas saponiphila]|uniref:Uncharacterized protein n=1 Tax=Pseudomonas saponiphila TaxID=556534 RepID=A0A1H4Y3U2_9PSED|nr:hypothetical protein [Pseudomonas saponiphila]SED11831.1 hypothetical protein SAMN05216178_6306 [Pseudomonas saponiphila]
MIGEIEELLEYWGEQQRRLGLGGGLASQMGTIMQWKGGAPRGVPGTREPLNGAGLDPLAHEVDAALATIERSSATGMAMYRLAELRYFTTPTPTVREQMQLLEISEGATQTYYDRVHSLHGRLQRELKARLLARRRVTVRRGGLPQVGVKSAST